MEITDLESQDFKLTRSRWCRVKSCLFNGKHQIDIRVWYKKWDSDYEVPTSRGIMFSAEKLPEIATYLNQLAGYGPRT